MKKVLCLGIRNEYCNFTMSEDPFKYTKEFGAH
jgi:hypothetical protein